jgi:hypothetical protein
MFIFLNIKLISISIFNFEFHFLIIINYLPKLSKIHITWHHPKGQWHHSTLVSKPYICLDTSPIEYYSNLFLFNILNI